MAPSTSQQAEIPTIVAFDVLAATATFLGALVVLTAFFSPRIYRRPTWYGAIIPSFLYTASFLLLLGQQHVDVPSYNTCVFQAFLIYAFPPHCTTALMCFAIDLYVTAKGIILDGEIRRPSSRQTAILILLPFLGFIASVITTLLVLVSGANRPVIEWQLHFYCHARVSTPSLVSSVITLCSFCVLSVVLGRTALLIHRHYSGLKQQGCLHHELMSLAIRMSVLSCGIFFGIAIGIVSILDVPTAGTLGAFAYLIAPIVVFVSLGSQRDIMMELTFWKKRNVDRATMSLHGNIKKEDKNKSAA